MKKYDEMAEDVFRRIAEYNAEKQRKRKKLVHTLVPVACVCLAVLIGVGVWKVGSNDPEPVQTLEDAVVPGTKDWYGPGEEEVSEIPSETKGPEPVAVDGAFVYLCSVENGGNMKSEPIEPFKSYDSDIYLEFVSIEGFTEEQIEEQIEACKEKAQHHIAQYGDYESYFWGCRVLREEAYLVSKVVLDSFVLALDTDQVEQITVTNTCEYGQVDVFGMRMEDGVVTHGKTVTIQKDQITSNLSFSWNYTRINHYFQENPAPAYSDFNDTLCFTVEYTDGTVATASIEILFNELGEAMIGCGGYETTV